MLFSCKKLYKCGKFNMSITKKLLLLFFCSRSTWASINNLANCKGVGAAGAVAVADWCSSHFICLFIRTHICIRTVVGLSELSMPDCGKRLINGIRKICRNTTQQQTSNKHFTNCHWQLGAFALFILAHKRLYMIMQPLTSNSVRARPVRPRATVAVAWHTCVIAGSPLDVFFSPHIFSFSIFPPSLHVSCNVLHVSWNKTRSLSWRQQTLFRICGKKPWKLMCIFSWQSTICISSARNRQPAARITIRVFTTRLQRQQFETREHKRNT